MYVYSLIFYYFVLFMQMGCTAGFAGIYFQEIGMSNTQIGALLSLPAMLAMLSQPIWGMVADRASVKRNVLAVAVGGYSFACFLVGSTANFWLLALIFVGWNAFSRGFMPIGDSIALEYLNGAGRDFGKVRLFGTLGYQAGLLLIGLIMRDSLKGLYNIVGGISLVLLFVVFTMPKIAGHQRESGVKVSPFALLKDKDIALMIAMLIVASTGSCFYFSFFMKYFSSLGADNALVAVTGVVSVLLEIPLLFFSSKLIRKMGIFQWMSIGMALNGLRFLGIAFCTNLTLQVLLQVPGVIILFCFNLIPALFIAGRVAPELRSSGQSLVMLINFGVAQMLGTLIGGALSDVIGVDRVFILLSVMLMLGGVIFFTITRNRKIPVVPEAAAANNSL